MVSFCGKNVVLLRRLAVTLLLGLLLLAGGCLCDTPPEGEMPWNTPNERDGMIPLPNSMLNRYN